MAEFKDRLKQLRIEKDLVQEDLAKVLDVTKMAISSYERGERKPRFEALDTLADYLDVNIDYLMGSSDIRKPYPRMTEKEQDEIGAGLIRIGVTPEEHKLIKAYRELDDHAKQIIKLTANI